MDPGRRWRILPHPFGWAQPAWASAAAWDRPDETSAAMAALDLDATWRADSGIIGGLGRAARLDKLASDHFLRSQVMMAVEVQRHLNLLKAALAAHQHLAADKAGGAAALVILGAHVVAQIQHG